MSQSQADNLRGIPQNPRRVKELIAFADHHAAILRHQAGVGMAEPLGPQVIASAFGVKFVQLDAIANVADEDRSRVSKLTPKQWSGMSLPLPSGGILVMLNPEQTPERANVTIMEEVAHNYLEHKPVTLVAAGGEGIQRHFDAAAEQEAYWLAAATLLPSSAVGHGVWSGTSSEELAVRYGVSTELVEFRIKTLRLWQEYNRRHRVLEEHREAA